MVYKYLVLVTILALSLVPAGFAAAASQKPLTLEELALYKGPDRQQLLEAGAKAEGNLTIYTTATEEQYRPIVKAYQKKYPYVKVDLWRGGGDALTPRITEEYRAKKYIVDAVRVSGASEIVLREAGILRPYYSPEIAAMEKTAIIMSPDGKGALSVGNCGSVQGLGYNTKQVAREEVPKSHQDLLNPKWKGKMAVNSGVQGLNWLGSLLTTLGEKFVKQMAQQEITVHAVSARALCSMVSAGEVTLSPTITDAHVMQDKKKGYPIDWVALEPVCVILGQMVLPMHPPHPHAAMLYLDLELSKEAAHMYEAEGFDSPRTDMPGARTYKKFYGAQTSREVQEWNDLFRRLFLAK